MQPPRLFKYLPPERVNILEEQRITFTPPERFNDAFDTKPKVVPITSQTYLKARTNPYAKEALQQLPPEYWKLPRKKRREIARQIHKGFLKHMENSAEQFAETLQGDIHSELNKMFGLLCLSAEPNNDLMWAHYAKGHEGFIIEFNVSHPTFQQLGRPHEMIYSDSPPTYDPTTGSQGWWKIKKKIWAYEREFRIVSELNACKQETKDGQKLFFRQLPKESVKAVYVGLKASDKTRSRIHLACKESVIEIFEAKYSRGGSTIEFQKK